MLRIFLMALLTMALAVPVAAQQEPGAGQERGAETGQANRAGQQGMTQDTTGAAATDRAATETTTETTDTEADTDDDMGGEMPTTASALPLVLLGGALLVAAGLGVRLARRS